jgi:hypothetical protein
VQKIWDAASPPRRRYLADAMAIRAGHMQSASDEGLAITAFRCSALA